MYAHHDPRSHTASRRTLRPPCFPPNPLPLEHPTSSYYGPLSMKPHLKARAEAKRAREGRTCRIRAQLGRSPPVDKHGAVQAPEARRPPRQQHAPVPDAPRGAQSKPSGIGILWGVIISAGWGGAKEARKTARKSVFPAGPLCGSRQLLLYIYYSGAIRGATRFEYVCIAVAAYDSEYTCENPPPPPAEPVFLCSISPQQQDCRYKARRLRKDEDEIIPTAPFFSADAPVAVEISCLKSRTWEGAFSTGFTVYTSKFEVQGSTYHVVGASCAG